MSPFDAATLVLDRFACEPGCKLWNLTCSTTGRILAKLEETAQRGLFLFLCFAVVVPNIPLAMALTLTLPIPIVHSCTPLSPI